jgi:hypothetical protein
VHPAALDVDVGYRAANAFRQAWKACAVSVLGIQLRPTASTRTDSENARSQLAGPTLRLVMALSPADSIVVRNRYSVPALVRVECPDTPVVTFSGTAGFVLDRSVAVLSEIHGRPSCWKTRDMSGEAVRPSQENGEHPHTTIVHFGAQRIGDGERGVSRRRTLPEGRARLEIHGGIDEDDLLLAGKTIGRSACAITPCVIRTRRAADRVERMS